MKRFFYLFLGGILLIGCQDRLSYLSDTRDDAPITKAEELSTDFSIDEPYTFISENNSKIWADVIGIEDRFQVCEVPEEDLKRMTTEALVKTMLKYPLNVIYSAYDAPLDAIRLIFKNSALHRELAGRDDAATVLLRYFAQTSIDNSIKKSILNKSDFNLTYVNEMFFEYFLASRLVPDLYNKKNEPLLRDIAIRKIHERRADKKTFSEVSVQPLVLILGEDPDELRNSDVDTPEEPLRASNWTWYSVFSKSISVEQNRTELTDDEVTDLLLYYYYLYPNSIVSANPSNRYNSNGYAWLIREGLNVPYSPNPTMSNSWVRDTYYYDNNNIPHHQIESLFISDIYETCSASDAEVVFYEDTYRSAIKLPSGKYRSKWANGPLMEHYPDECPYVPSGKQYYKKRTTPMLSLISGEAQVIINHAENYSFQPIPERSVSIQWSVENITTHNTSSFILSNANSSTCTITFLEVAAYIIHLDVYLIDEDLNSHLIITKEKNITSYAS